MIFLSPIHCLSQCQLCWDTVVVDLCLCTRRHHRYALINHSIYCANLVFYAFSVVLFFFWMMVTYEKKKKNTIYLKCHSALKPSYKELKIYKDHKKGLIQHSRVRWTQSHIDGLQDSKCGPSCASSNILIRESCKYFKKHAFCEVTFGVLNPGCMFSVSTCQMMMVYIRTLCYGFSQCGRF